MEELVKRVVEEFGHLVSVLGGTTDVPDPALPVRFEQYESGFEHGYLTISAAHDDDTDRLTDSRMALPRTVVLSASAPWSTAVGSGHPVDLDLAESQRLARWDPDRIRPPQ